MKVFVTGATGQLGYDVIIELAKRGYYAIGSGGRMRNHIRFPTTEIYNCTNNSEYNIERRKNEKTSLNNMFSNTYENGVVIIPYYQLNITDRKAVQEIIHEISPDVIIHCAAWTAVDAAEEEENKTKVDAINHLGTQYIAEAAKVVGAKMMYISTDYVFDGKGERPWAPDDKCFAPLNVYGRSKLDGELAVSSTLEKFFVVRISWVFGRNGKNFIKTMIDVGKKHDAVYVVNDQIGTPTYTSDLARLLVDMIATNRYGYYHATNEGGYISWYDFCCEFYQQYGLETKVIPVTTEEYGVSKAARPFNSRLDKRKLIDAGFQPLPDWKDAVKRFLADADL